MYQDSFYNTKIQRVETMSLVRSGDPATAAYRNTKLYSIQGISDNSCLSAQMFGSDKHNPVCINDSYSSESYKKYFLDSPMEELIHSFNFLEIQSLDTLDSDTDKMKLKLQELERALPADNDVYEEVDMFGAGLSMEIDGEWSDPIGTDQSLHDSHKESSSSDSYHSSISSNKEVSHASSKIPKQMLIHCAAVLSDMFCW
ncbi:hypothetical protein ERO13_D03G061700v2 [Gossypium hirsutum]|uniref:Uncharacterized protein n=1 Tax=Gossypium tomentosum TaxID=34277 RepID=A0A5D2LM16_GOSTO|nr:hypothetical protein ERO13_D03G061700v2 [Gossypium hirsutum]TYH79694.1 hypothetical protein ES332_D03G080900v1 [Gossypium tomentosum]